MEYTYNLIDQPWIPVVDSDGRPRDVSLRNALINAHLYHQLSASFPHTNAALYRLLLAILHRNFGPCGEEEWLRLWHAGHFQGETLDNYFEKWRERFDLFSPEHPFMQSRHEAIGRKPANALLFLVAGGDPDTLYDHNTDNNPVTLTPQQAVLALITAHSFGLAGLCHPQLGLVYTDAPCARGAVFFLQGQNLFESLMLNLVRYNRFEPIAFHGEAPDLPAWEMDNPYFPDRTLPLGYLDFLTWQNRRIMLFPSLIHGQIVVKEVTSASGLTLSPEVRNPMHHYRIDEDTGRKIHRFSEGKALWRDSSALLNLRGGYENPQALRWAEELISYGYLPEQKLRLVAYGMSTEPGKQKVHFYRGEQFDFPNRLLKDEQLVNVLNQALDLATVMGKQLWGSLQTLATLLLSSESDLPNGRKPEPKDINNLLAHWEGENHYWSRLEVPFFQFLDQLGDNPESAMAKWKQALRDAVLNAFRLTAMNCGNSMKAMKATAIAGAQMRSGMYKVLPLENLEDKHAVISE